MRSTIQKNSLVLALFALVTTTLLGGTYLSTRDKIEHSERKAAQKALFEVVPVERHSNDMLVDTLSIPQAYWQTLGLKQGGNVHIARRDSEIVAMIIPAVAPDGYSGDIKFIVGINRDASIAGVRVLSHRETPGLGDKVDLKKHDWILGFNGKSLAKPTPSSWKVKKDKGEFDQFTGATITPRAVVKQVFQVLNYYNDDSKRLLKEATRNNSPSQPVTNPQTRPQKSLKQQAPGENQ